MIKEAIKKVVQGKNLTREEASLSMDMIMQGNATPSQIAALITALHTKGESIDEITGFAQKMKEHATKIYPKVKNLVDTCGTGGDYSGTFNISTVASFVASGAGVPIAKHGNRSMSSKSGSADLLEALGVKVDLEPKKVEECIEKIKIGFIYAPNFHKAMKYAAPTRKEIGISTVFNILGPLTNPASAEFQVLGVFHEELTEIMSEVLKNLGTKSAMVVHGMDGLDEISLTEKTKVSHLKDGKIRTFFIKPEDFGFLRRGREDVLGGDAIANAEIALEILNNEDKGPKKQIVLLNAAAAIVVSGIESDMKKAIVLANESIESGNALKKLNELISFSKGA